MVGSHFEVCWISVIFPVGESISNHETLKVWFEDGWVSSVNSIVMMNGVDSEWDINSSVRFSRNVEIVLLKFWELIEPADNSLNIICTHSVIVKDALFWLILSITPRVTNTSWLFDV